MSYEFIVRIIETRTINTRRSGPLAITCKLGYCISYSSSTVPAATRASSSIESILFLHCTYKYSSNHQEEFEKNSWRRKKNSHESSLFVCKEKVGRCLFVCLSVVCIVIALRKKNKSSGIYLSIFGIYLLVSVEESIAGLCCSLCPLSFTPTHRTV